MKSCFSSSVRPLSSNSRRRLICQASIALFVSPFVSTADAADGTWTLLNGGDASGLWSDSFNWSGGVIADGAGSTAFFNTLDVMLGSNIQLDTPRVIGNLVFGDTDPLTGANWFLGNNGNSANVLTLSGAAPTITVDPLGVGNSLTIGTASPELMA